jgi:hypothetical protein
VLDEINLKYFVSTSFGQIFCPNFRMGSKRVRKKSFMDAFYFHPKLWTRTKFWTGRDGDENPIPNSILWSLDFGHKFWLAVEML